MTPVHVVVINLLCRKSRRMRILKLVSLLKAASLKTHFPIVSVNILEAVDGVNQSFGQLEQRYGLKPFAKWAIPDPENRFPSSWRVNQTSGGIASGLSHLDVAALSVQLHHSLTLVMEDDCVLTVPPEAAYKYFCDCLATNSEWDLLLLGAAGMRPDIAPAEELAGDVNRAGFSYLTTMYWLSEAGAKKLTKNRKVCIENCLAFDELHNALAGLTGRVRSDVASVFKLCQHIELFSSKQSLVRQDPYDGVHDTVVIASSPRKEDDVAPPLRSDGSIFELEKLTPVTLTLPGRLDMQVVWHRRQLEEVDVEKLSEELGLKKPFLRRARERGGGGLLAVLAKLRSEKTQHLPPFERRLSDFPFIQTKQLPHIINS